MMARLGYAVLTVACVLLASPVVAEDFDPEGYWVTPNFSSIVRVDRCGDAGELCSELVWLYEVAIDKRSMLDKKNPNESLRDRPMVGLALFTNLRVTDSGWRGRIYNPGDGRRYRASISQPDANRLRLRGCWGPFCKRQTWRRLRTVTMPTEAILERSRR